MRKMLILYAVILVAINANIPTYETPEAYVETEVLPLYSAEPLLCSKPAEEIIVRPVETPPERVVEEPIAVPVIVEEIVEPDPPRYGFTDDELYLLTQLLCGSKNVSGDGEYDIDTVELDKINYVEVDKVLGVVMNRVMNGYWGATVTDVVLAKGQFSVMPRNLNAVVDEQSLRVVSDWCQAYDRRDDGVPLVPENHLSFTGNGHINTTRP